MRLNITSPDCTPRHLSLEMLFDAFQGFRSANANDLKVTDITTATKNCLFIRFFGDKNYFELLRFNLSDDETTVGDIVVYEQGKITILQKVERNILKHTSCWMLI